MAHIHTQKGEFDYTVSGFLVHNNKTLLIKHKSLPIWTAPAGHVELDESPIDALYKEIREEAGIDASHLELLETSPAAKDILRPDASTYIPVPFSMEYHPVDDGHRHINMSYILRCDTDIVTPGEDESQEYRWFTVEQLASFTETTVSIINEATYAIRYLEEQQS